MSKDLSTTDLKSEDPPQKSINHKSVIKKEVRTQVMRAWHPLQWSKMRVEKFLEMGSLGGIFRVTFRLEESKMTPIMCDSTNYCENVKTTKTRLTRLSVLDREIGIFCDF